MKRTKKLFSLALAFIMAMALMVPAFAADTSTITITGGNAGASYAGYRLLNLTASETNGTKSYNYTVNEKYRDVLKAQLNITEADAAKADALILAALRSMATDKVNEFADALYKKIVNQNIGADAVANESNVLTQASDGYWLIVETVTPGSNDIASKVILDTAGLADDNGNINIVSKKDTITLEKVDDKVTADIGDTVTYTLTSKVPDLTNFTGYTFIIHDTMSEGLSFNGYTSAANFAVKIGTTDVTSEVTTGTGVTVADGDDCSIHIQIPYSVLNRFSKNDTITVTYTATVNEKAEYGVENNKAYLVFSQNPYTGEVGQTPDDVEEVYNCKLDVIKYTDSNGNNAYDETDLRLAGAEFALYKMDGQNKVYYKWNGTTNDIEWVTVSDSESDNNDVVDAADIRTQATTKTTPENGEITFVGLAAGTYYLEEIQAPENYNILTEAVAVTVDLDNSNSSAVSYVKVQPILNNMGTELPSTGGMGTTIFYVVGGVLMAGAAILLITKKKMSNEQ